MQRHVSTIYLTKYFLKKSISPYFKKKKKMINSWKIKIFVKPPGLSFFSGY